MFTIYCSPWLLSFYLHCGVGVINQCEAFYVLTVWHHHKSIKNVRNFLGVNLNLEASKYLTLFADDDSEPILGLWFEETISPTKDKVAPPPPPPPPPLETSPRLKSPSKQNQSENGNILAGRKDPELVNSSFYGILSCKNFLRRLNSVWLLKSCKNKLQTKK